MKNSIDDAKYKWIILILAAMTNAVVAAAPVMSLSVLLPEISQELDLTLVQAGTVWGIGSMPIIITSLIAGILGDRFGPKRVLTVATFASALLGASRGLTTDFYSLAISVFLFGSFTPVIVLNNVKVTKIWFSKKDIGIANGVVGMGMAFGLLIGSMISATLLSPLLVGWRHVFFFYGALSATFVIPWYFARHAPRTSPLPQAKPGDGAIMAGIRQVAKIRNIWLLGFAVLGINGCIQGLLGYLPLYLRGIGWNGVSADSTLATFNALSLLGTLPISVWSDRLESRKPVLLGAATFMFIGVGSLSFLQGDAIWAAVVAAGMVRDGFMATLTTTVIETKGVRLAQSGTANGFFLIFLGIGNLIAPPLGNSLAGISASTPFLFWAFMCGIGIVCIILTRKT